ncbi:MAG TPA: hypothetical protein VFS92_09915 [Planctomycetota bacterium]|nr:hypothetical protein [Planctomycetota bacterium]
MKPRRTVPEGEKLEPIVRALDIRRIRQIRAWLEGTRKDAPTREELREFVNWVSGEIEFALARHQPTRDLIGFLNAAREELHGLDVRPNEA